MHLFTLERDVDVKSPQAPRIFRDDRVVELSQDGSWVAGSLSVFCNCNYAATERPSDLATHLPAFRGELCLRGHLLPAEATVDLPTTVRILSSMATRRLLADLTTQFESTSPLRLSVESVGGVDAAKRVRAGEPFDVIVLADNVIDALIAEGHIVEGSRVDLVASPVAVAVRAGTTHPDISSADAVKSAILAAASIGYSTGPSGTYLATLFDRWGVADAVKGRIRVAPPGVPVGSLVAKGELELGFQQLSEFVDLDGIDVVGLLPPEIQAITIFSGGVGRAAAQPDRAREVLKFMAGPSTVETKRRLGMEPALTL